MKKIKSKVSKIESKLDILFNEKKDILKDLVKIEDVFNSLAAEVTSADDWLYALPITSIKDVGSKKITHLGRLKMRSVLRKDSWKKVKELELVDQKIALTRIDLLSAKVESLLSE
jgi:hypothetical protein